VLNSKLWHTVDYSENSSSGKAELQSGRHGLQGK
jgi:hypothetical protein